MKLKLPFLMLFLLLAGKIFSQVTAYPVPDLVQCTNTTFNLNAQIPGVLGNQDPENHTVSFYNSMAAAEANFNVIANPSAYSGQNMETIYVRVENIDSGMWDIASFNLIVNNADLIDDMENVFTCTSYTIPPLNPLLNAVYSFNGVVIPGTAPFVITQSGNVVVTVTDPATGCMDGTEFYVYVGMIQVSQPESLVACDYDGDGFAIFDLTSSEDEILNGLTGFNITYHEDGSDAEQGENPIANPTAYTNSSLGQSNVMVRVQSNENPDCYTITNLNLIVQFCSYNAISGTITYDFDNNGCTAADMPAENISVYATAGNNSYQSFTNANGEYQLSNLPEGQYVVTVAQNNVNLNVAPVSHTVTMPGNGEDKDFCITSPSPVNDVAVTIIPATPARPGMLAYYTIVFQNLGNQPASGTVTFGFQDALMTYAGSSPAMTLTGSTLSFNYTNLLPFQTKMIQVSFLMDIPPVVNGGTILSYSASISPSANDINQANNIYALEQVVVNSYDPNDITVHEGAYVTLDQAQQRYLTYTIRFQNVGTAEALKVRIANTLEADLNASTFTPVAASHTYNVVRHNNEIEFVFDDINLAGAQQNEPMSHGFVTYKIKPKANVALGDVMNNQAAIYFDFNQPVITNEVTTTVQNVMGVADNAVKGFSMYPNPASGKVTLQMENMNQADVAVTDILGKTVLTVKAIQAEQAIDISALNSGMYFITVTAEGRSVTKKLMVK